MFSQSEFTMNIYNFLRKGYLYEVCSEDYYYTELYYWVIFINVLMRKQYFNIVTADFYINLQRS